MVEYYFVAVQTHRTRTTVVAAAMKSLKHTNYYYSTCFDVADAEKGGGGARREVGRE